MLTAKNSELIDFSALKGDQAPERSRLLLENLTSLLQLTSPTCSAAQLSVYDDVFMQLVDMVETEARKALAEKLSLLPRAPSGIVRKMAADDIEVAEPILRSSNVLDTVDLRYLAETKPDDHLTVISSRGDLETSVTDVIIGRGGEPVLIALISNPLAPVSRAGFSGLIEKSKDNLHLQRGLGDRVDFPSDLLQVFIAMASEAVRDRLSGRPSDQAQTVCVPLLDETMDSVGSEIVATLSREIAGNYYDFDGALIRISKLSQSGKLTQDFLIDVASQGLFADVVCTHSLLTGLPLDEALAQLTASTPDDFLIAARACDYGEQTVRLMFRCGPWRNATSQHVIEATIIRFLRLERATAQRIMQERRPAKSA